VSDVFEEVEENLRRDQYVDFFRRYGVWLGAGLVALLAAVGAWSGYQSYQAREAASYADKLDQGEKLLQAGDFAAADRFFTDMSKSAPRAYKTAALTFAAAALIEQGDIKTAMARLDEAAGSERTPILRDNAKLKAAYLAADIEDYKTLKPRLTALVDAGGPLVYQARELLGSEAYEAGDLAEAREQFNFLSLALDAPEGVRNRARSALAVLGPEPAAPPAAAPPAAAPPAAAPPASKKPGESK
jgi:hypothetical protein